MLFFLKHLGEFPFDSVFFVLKNQEMNLFQRKVLMNLGLFALRFFRPYWKL